MGFHDKTRYTAEETLRLLSDRKMKMTDEETLADAFLTIRKAAYVINSVLSRNQALNETIPSNWPLGFSADEFADECGAVADHYSTLSVLSAPFAKATGE